MHDSNRERSTRLGPDAATRTAEGRIQAALASVRRAIRTHTMLGIAVAGVLVGWGRWLYGSVGEVDASYVAAYARERVEASLPAAHDLFADHLRRAAPGVVNRALEHLYAAPALLRGRLQGMFEKEIERLASGLEVELSERLRAEISSARRHLDTKMAGLTDRERVDYLAEEFVRDYQRNVERVLHHHVGPYSDSLETLRRDLDHLGSGRSLSERERLQREILAVFLELHRRAASRGEEGFLRQGFQSLLGTSDGF